MVNPFSLSLRTSLYADDAAIFINSSRDEIVAVKDILHASGCALGMVTNLEKSSIHPIRCEDIDLDHVLQPFHGTRGNFPCRYLGLQLHTRPLWKIHIQPLNEKIGNRLAGWKGNLLNRAGRLTLVSSVLSSMPTYHLSVFPSRFGRTNCNTPSNPWTGGTYSWQLSRIIYCPHRPTRVFCAHFVLTHAHPRKLLGRSPIPNFSKPSTLNLEALSR
jgi:hypothetical protein